MTIEFTAKKIVSNPYLVAEARIVFGPGLLFGLALEGFAIWKRGRALSVTFPARPYVKEGKTAYHWHLRAAKADDHVSTERLQQYIVDAYQAQMLQGQED